MLATLEILNGVIQVINRYENRRMLILLNTKHYPILIEKISKLKYRIFENSDLMDLKNRVTKKFGSNVVTGYSISLYFVEMAVTALILSGIIIKEIGILGIIFPIISLPMIIVSQKNTKDLYHADEKSEKYNRYFEYLEELLKNREAAVERNIFESESFLRSMWNNHFLKTYEIIKNIRLKVVLRMLGYDIITFLAYIIVIFILGWALINKRLEYSVFIALVITVMKLMNHISYTLAENISILARSILFLNDYNQLISLEEDEGANDLPIENINFESLEFRNVSFTYPNSEYKVLDNMNFLIEKSKKYAFVGKNGAGKSTIINLLLRLYEPDSGEILLNGKDLKEYKYSEIKGIYSTVLQHSSRYPITIREYLTLGLKDVPDEKIIKALNDVGLDEVMEDKSITLDTELGKLSSDSMELSGGQWQRLSIAKALISDRQIMILDEPTSSIDPIREKEIYDMFNVASKDKTTILISHRLGSTKFADIIFVVENGAIIESGSHKELMLKNKVYSNMYNLQSGWYQNESD